ncbi:MAG TPA: 3-hydroxybutyrate oligomer hydrolase family protein, partial [Stenotrophomonas sp.]
MKTSLMNLAGGLLFGMSLAHGAVAAQPAGPFGAERESVHRDGDDLLTAGLGLAGLRAMAPPAFADPALPTPAEARRRAFWSNWRGIADLAPGGGYGERYGSLANVPGREFTAYARLPDRHQPHRVLVQVPDNFDTQKRCLLVTASSGSRGIYGSIAVAGAWGLPRGCAVAYTDKGAGTDYVDLASAAAVGPEGVAGPDSPAAFAPAAAHGPGVAFKHAHSQDNPEADWGRHVRQAAEFGLQVLNRAVPGKAPYTFENTRVIAVGISNGGGAVLRAAELDPGGKPWLAAVVAGEPSVLAPGKAGRALYDYVTEAALLMPCALYGMEGLPQPPLSAQLQAQGAARCASLAVQGLVTGTDATSQSADARRQLMAQGWTEASLRSGALSVGFDLWRSVAVAYASAYGRYAFDAHPCGYRYAAMGTDGAPRAATGLERAAWWSDGSGIPPGAGIGVVDPQAQPGADPTFAGLQCLRALWTGHDAHARRVQAGIAQTRAALPRKHLPIVVVHGLDDGLIPPAFSSAPYVAAARAAGRDVRYWQVPHVQHFDGFLGLP